MKQREIISEVRVKPYHAGTFTNQIAKIINVKKGESIGELELRALCKDLSSEELQHFIDELNGEACLYCIGMSDEPQDVHKADKLFNVVKMLEKLKGVGYENQDEGGGGSQPMDFPQENQEALRLPVKLRTPQAMDYWRKLQENGYVTSDFKPLGTKKQMALIAIEFSTAMGWKTKYKPFADLWGHNAKSMQEAVRRIRNGNREEWQVIIENIFRTQQNNNNTPTS